MTCEYVDIPMSVRLDLAAFSILRENLITFRKSLIILPALVIGNNMIILRKNSNTGYDHI